MKNTIDVANVLVQNSKSEVLLLQRAPRLKRGYIWGMPGGIIDTGETALQAAMRELLEETGIKDANISVTGILRFLVEMPDEDVRITNVRANLLDDATSIDLDPDEHIAYKWATETEIFASSNLLPCVPTMIAQTLNAQAQFADLTITPGIRVTLL
jgi:mutator protein MutT